MVKTMDENKEFDFEHTEETVDELTDGKGDE